MITQETRDALPVRKLDKLERLEDCLNPKFDCQECGWPVPLLNDFSNRRGNLAGCLNCGTWQDNPFYDGRGLNVKTQVEKNIQPKNQFVFPGCHLFVSPCPGCESKIQATITPNSKAKPINYKCGCGLSHSAEGLFSHPDMREEKDPAKLWGVFERYAEAVEVWS